MRTPAPPLAHNIGYQRHSQAWKLTISKRRVDRMGAHTSVVKKNTNEIQWHVKSEWKTTEIWKAKGKRRWTPKRAVAQGT